MSSTDEIELKFALADTDAKFQAMIKKHLSFLLRTLQRQNETEKKDTLNLLNHILKRLRSTATLTCDLTEVIEVMAQNNPDNLSQAIAFMFFSIGFPRYSIMEAFSLFPNLLNLNLNSKQQRTEIHHNLLQCIVKWNSASPLMLEVFDYWRQVDLAQPGWVHFLRFLREVMMYSPGSDSSNSSTTIASDTISNVTNYGKSSWYKGSDNFVDTKNSILKFFFEGIRTDLTWPAESISLIFIIFVVASTLGHHKISDLGESGVKLLLSSGRVNLDDPKVVAAMFTTYLSNGSNGLIPTSAMKQNLLVYFLRSTTSSSIVPFVVQVIFDSLFGPLSDDKLKKSGLIFLRHVAQTAKASVLGDISGVLVGGLLKFQNLNQSLQGIEISFHCLGDILRRVPQNHCHDIELLNMMFQKFATVNRDHHDDIRGAITTMLECYKCSSEISKNDIMELLLTQINSENHKARFCALKYAIELFPFSSVKSRFICLIGSVDEMTQNKNEAVQFGFSPSSTAMRADFPDPYQILLLVNNLLSQSNKKMAKLIENTLLLISNLHVILAVGPENLRVSSCLEDDLTSHPSFNRQIYIEYLGKVFIDLQNPSRTNNSQSDIYIKLINYGLLSLSQDNNNSNPIASSVLLNMIMSCPNFAELSRSCIDILSSILFKASDIDIGGNVARSLAILITLNEEHIHVDKIRIEKLLLLALDNIQNLKPNVPRTQILLSIQFLGFVIGRLRYFHLLKSSLPFSRLLQDTIICIFENVKFNEDWRCCAAFKAIGEIYRRGPLKGIEDFMVGTEFNPSSKLETIIKQLQKEKKMKVLEGGIMGISYIALGTPEKSEEFFDIFEHLIVSLEIDINIHFTLGEAMDLIFFGYESELTYSMVDLPNECLTKQNIDAESRLKVREKGEEKLLHLFRHMKQSVRRGVAICLLCLLRNSRSTYKIRADFLRKAHEEFTQLLSDRDETIQEISSKGLSLIYELGGENLKKELVESLVNALEGKKQSTQKLNEDTVLFEKGELGKDLDGEALSTYKSILSLATETNQPDLVYKFISLSSSHGIWNTKKGAAFGFALIAHQAEDYLQPYLKKIVPKLYRYQYDPNIKVSQAMRRIWERLNQGSQNLVNENVEFIMEDIIISMGKREWRTRESACVAFRSLIGVAEITKIEPFLERLWIAIFRVLDDIKDSVRIAAFETCRTLSNYIIRYSNPSTSSAKRGEILLQTVLPLLLDKGIHNHAKEVRSLSLSTVLGICKNSGKLLKPYLTKLIVSLLESISSLESPELNYLSFHTEKYGISHDEFEKTRVMATQVSPIMEAVLNTIPQVDNEILEELSSALVELIRRGVGLTTKTSTARFIIGLCMANSLNNTVHASSLLKASSGLITDKSPVIRQAYASVCGYLVKLVDGNMYKNFIKHLNKIYCGNPVHPQRDVVPYICRETSKHSSDYMRSNMETCISLIFFGRGDSASNSKAFFDETWTELGCSGSTGYIYFEELTIYLAELSQSPCWDYRKQSPECALLLSNEIGDRMTTSQIKILINIFLTSLEGRTWQGKERVLKSMVETSCGNSLLLKETSLSNVREQIEQAIYTEFKKEKDLLYKKYATECLTKFYSHFDCEKFEKIAEELLDIVKRENPVQERDNENEFPLLLSIKEQCLYCLGNIWPIKLEEEKAESSIRQILPVLLESLGNGVWNIKLAILKVLNQILKKVGKPFFEYIFREGNEMSAFVMDVIQVIDGSKYVSIRKEGLGLLLLISTMNGEVINKWKIKEDTWNTVHSWGRKVLSQEKDGEVEDICKKVLFDIEKQSFKSEAWSFGRCCNASWIPQGFIFPFSESTANNFELFQDQTKIKKNPFRDVVK